MKYIIVTGGVLSGLGKGVTSSSLGVLLQRAGYRVTAVKIDPYLNCDAGTMNPYQHGEVFVMTDGAEVDLDLGNYERFLDCNLTAAHNITTGKVYRQVINRERRGDYLGDTVQIIPHIVNQIKDSIKEAADKAKADICIVKMGGTVGDIESMPFLEAVRQLHREVDHPNLVFVHTTLVPVMGVVGEQKTKPTQHSVKELRGLGIHPDVIVARCENPLEKSIIEKLSLFTDVPRRAIISAANAPSIYHVPLRFDSQGVTAYMLDRLGLPPAKEDLSQWRRFVSAWEISQEGPEVELALIGKYTHLKDSYISHVEAFNHAAAALGCRPKIRWLEATELEDKGAEFTAQALAGVDGVLVPGGFGVRGSQGKILATAWARENQVPFLGICFGFQMAVAEFGRSVMGLEGANSSELDEETPHAVISLLPEQEGVEDMGATMRLGSHPVLLAPDSRAATLYKATDITERHRHRFEVNPDYIERYEAAGLRFTGRDPSGRRMEVCELEGHPFFVASQFHPEFKSRPHRPSALHYGFLEAAMKQRVSAPGGPAEAEGPLLAVDEESNPVAAVTSAV